MESEGYFALLEDSVHAALETYSNVHRGSGLYSSVTTRLFDHARDLVLEFLGLSKGKYVLIFCTERRAEGLISLLSTGSFHSISSKEFGLSIGVRALAVKRTRLPKGIPLETGGGTTQLVAPEWVLWAKAPERFEAGTPPIVNIIAFARALQLIKQFGKDIFRDSGNEKLSASAIQYEDELKEYTGNELLVRLRQAVIGGSVTVPALRGPTPFINLDNAASTQTFTPVWKSFCKTLNQTDDVKKEIVREAKSILAKMLGAPSGEYEVIFTSNTTEAINLVAESERRKSGDDFESVILCSLLEHSSNDLPWRKISKYPVIRLSVNKEGFLSTDELESVLSEYNPEGRHDKKRISLVALSGASNVLGVYNDLAEISRIVHKYGARLLVDAAQLVAHRKVETEKWDVDYLTFSSHKVYAPFGTGALVVKKGLLNFSSEEKNRILSSGEENAGGIAALGKAMNLLQRIGMDLIQEKEQRLTAKVLRGLAQINGLRVYGLSNPDSPDFARRGGVFAFTMEGAMSNVVAKELAVRGIGIRYGCHCSHILVKHILGVSPGLARFQKIMLTLLPMVQLPGVARVSLGIQNSEEEVDILLMALKEISDRYRKSEEKNKPSGQHVKDAFTKKEVQKQMKDFVRKLIERVYCNH